MRALDLPDQRLSCCGVQHSRAEVMSYRNELVRLIRSPIGQMLSTLPAAVHVRTADRHGRG
jgi:hypothetical protein